MKKLIVLSCLSLVLFACKRYEEGGFVSKSEKHLTGKTWKLASYLRNGTDETSTLWISNLQETYNEDGVLLKSYIYDSATISKTGSWELKADTKQLKIDGVGSIPLSAQTSTVSSSDLEIIKLTKDEFWYYFENGSDRHEFHFTAN
jgi:hypothetical protein